MSGPEGGLGKQPSKREQAMRALRAAIVAATAVTGAAGEAVAQVPVAGITQPKDGEKIPLPPRRSKAIEALKAKGIDPASRGITERPAAFDQTVAVPMPRPRPLQAAPQLKRPESPRPPQVPAFSEESLRDKEPLFTDEVPFPGVIQPAPKQSKENALPLPPQPKVGEVEEDEPAEKFRKPESKERKQSRAAFLKQLTFGLHGYAGNRIEEENFHNLKPAGLRVTPHPIHMQHLHLHARLGRFSLEGGKEDVQLGRFERSLRFKNITDAVERRYNLPPALLLAMLIQESSGADVFPNGRDDGGIGLIHMQPSVAVQFGLKTFGNNRELVDKGHGRALRVLIAQKKSDPFELAKHDERFNRLLNIDAVGRMLATHMSGSRISGLGPLRTAVKRYTGKFNYGRYTTHLRHYMRLLNDRTFLASLAEKFDARNRDLVVNGKAVGEKSSAFAAYTQAFWEQNEKGFDLAGYRKLTKYRPEESDTGLRTYKKFFIERKR